MCGVLPHFLTRGLKTPPPPGSSRQVDNAPTPLYADSMAQGVCDKGLPPSQIGSGVVSLRWWEWFVKPTGLIIFKSFVFAEV